MKVTRKAEETPLFPPAVKGNNQEGCKSGIEEEGKAGRRKEKKTAGKGREKEGQGRQGRRQGRDWIRDAYTPLRHRGREGQEGQKKVREGLKKSEAWSSVIGLLVLMQ
jgi:hypothetical protein